MFETYVLPILIYYYSWPFSRCAAFGCPKGICSKADERIERVREALPGVNCGVCGFFRLDEYAASITIQMLRLTAVSGSR